MTPQRRSLTLLSLRGYWGGGALPAGGELLDAVMELGSYGERDAATIMGRLFNGLESIHSKNISHRDLKLENLILAGGLLRTSTRPTLTLLLLLRASV